MTYIIFVIGLLFLFCERESDDNSANDAVAAISVKILGIAMMIAAAIINGWSA